MTIIYEKEIECEAHLIAVKIEEEMWEMMHATLKQESTLFKKKGIKEANMGHLPIKILIKIESE